MATKQDIETDLALELDGNVTIPQFLKATKAFLGYVDEITEASAIGQQRPEWIVQVKEGSNLIQVSPQPGFNPVIVDAAYRHVQRGLEQIDNIAELEADIPESALRNLRSLSEVVNEDFPVRLWIRRQPIAVSQKVAAAISEFYGAGYKDYGSVDGRLQVVSERGSDRAEITDPLNGKIIKCYVSPELMSVALQLFRRRVEAYGKIRYRADGTVLSIEVEEFVPFLPPEQIPSFRDVRGILKDYV